MNRVLFSSKKHSWETPQDFFDELHKEFGFTLDAAANRKNKKCERYLGPKSPIAQDALSCDWGVGEVIWLNCPYGFGVRYWMKKAYEQSLRGNTVVCLVAARTDTLWFHEFVQGKAEVRFVRGRLKFVGAEDPATFPSMLAIFRPPAVPIAKPKRLGKVKLLCGDSLSRLKKLPSDKFQCVVTSPPYFNLRDYGVDGQIGCESDLAEYIDRLVSVFREVRRVLKPDGVCWLNIGDCYASSASAGTKKMGNEEFNKGRPSREATKTPKKVKQKGFRSKDTLMVPHRLAIALQADGWIVRQDIVWSKPAAMPESVTDRFTRAHEYVFLLCKSDRYYFDSGAVKEAAVSTHASGNGYNRPQQKSRGGRGQQQQWTPTPLRNRRDVWTIHNKPYKFAHFAVMPEELVRLCILSSTKEKDIVLDPFVGAATVPLVARRHGRHSVGIDLNRDYLKLAIRRLRGKEK